MIPALFLLLTPGADAAEYLGKIKPLFATRCLACHGALEQKGGLRLDTVARMLQGGDTGPAIVPGKPRNSLLWQRASGHDKAPRMPPRDEGDVLNPEQLARLEQWIASGAPAPAKETGDPDPRDHWSFRKPSRITPAAPSANPIDAWITKRWQEQGLTPRPPADKLTLLRRLHLDLTGLAPSSGEIDAFLADQTPDAYRREVDRLLASPRHAERWARHFMDIWRYSDWWGLGAEVRNSQKNIWHWRDWIIESLEADLPYDEMVRQMLAADELYPTDTAKLRASGFLARQYFLFNRTSWMDETVEHTAKAFLGLTVNCAKCHDHKYDPIRADDYYRLRAVFEPYQVRFDAPEGSVDATQGFPRAYDCNADKVTHKHIRGDEAKPDTRRKMMPGALGFLDFQKFEVREVPLPTSAHAPETRPAVLQAYLKAAEAALLTARQAEKSAVETLRKTEKSAPPSVSQPGKVLVADSFDKLDTDLWTVTGAGQWQAAGGKVAQVAKIDTRTSLKLKKPLPADFEITLRLAITGGEPWRSVGVAFDTAEGRENLVYLSANATEPKLQIAHQRGGTFQYPDLGKQSRPVPLNTPFDLTLRVQGTSVEALLDGKPGAHLLLPDRLPGSLELIAFTATCSFEKMEIRELASGYQAPKSKTLVTVEQARAGLALARAELAAREAEPAMLRARHKARLDQLTLPVEQARVAAREAARLETAWAVLQAQAALARAEREMILEGAGKKPAMDAAKKALADAEKSAREPGEKFTRLVVSVKAPESNIETAESKTRPFPPTSTGRRSALARWITSRENPLTARVIVNHVWNRHFGQPLVPTVFDFGRKGTPPSHPELLDTLAVELMEHGWSLRHLHRLIVTSRAYQLDSSTAQPAEQARDPENRSLWRYPAHRLEAQALRDSLLHLAGTLDITRGGPPIPVAEAGGKRRGIYYFHSHNEHEQFLAQFDDAQVLECYRRQESIVPQQALAMAHAGLSLDAAQGIAGRLSRPGDNPREFVLAAHRVLLARLPGPTETDLCLKALAELGKGPSGQDTTPRARTLLVLALLNHHDFLTQR